MNLLPLQKGILYGPVASRRLGKSLGINLMPTEYKLCSFNCIYCHYGWTKEHTVDATPFAGDMPRFDDIISAVRNVLLSGLEFDYLTFSGNGEPTLYPEFASLAAEVARVRDKHRSGLKIALLSNASGLFRPGVKEGITHIDVPVFKIDAGTEGVFGQINRPAPGVCFADIIKVLGSLRDIFVQSVLVHGSPGNADEENLIAYFDRIKEVQPAGVQIYSIDRPVPNDAIRRVSPGDLQQIAVMGRRKTGIEFKAFFMR